jgi:hypothetical protein
VESRRESTETLVAASDAGTEFARVFPSKIIVGFAAVVALADVEDATIDAIAKRPTRVVAIDLCVRVISLDSMVIDILVSPSMKHFNSLKQP